MPGTTTKKKTYVLRTCDADMRSYGGFRWPESGPVEAPDWSPESSCGDGLHGLRMGQGAGALLSWEADAKWLVVEVLAADVVDLGGKVKFPRGNVVFCGDQRGATDFLGALGAVDIIGATVVAGNHGTATAGYRGTATAGDFGTATAGDRGTATAGALGTATAGALGTATAGYSGTAIAGYLGTATAAGDHGTAIAGYRGTATAAGNHGTATAGYRGTATAGYSGTATAGYGGTATAGDLGTVCIWWFDANRRRLAVGCVGENGIKPGVAYRCDDAGRLVEA